MAQPCFAANAGVRPAMPTTIAIRPERREPDAVEGFHFVEVGAASGPVDERADLSR
jgi:hypothetical protein